MIKLLKTVGKIAITIVVMITSPAWFLAALLIGIVLGVFESCYTWLWERK